MTAPARPSCCPIRSRLIGARSSRRPSSAVRRMRSASRWWSQVTEALSSLADSQVLVVGAGLAGVRAAEALRGYGYAGGITVIEAADEIPCARPPLSKEFLRGDWE